MIDWDLHCRRIVRDLEDCRALAAMTDLGDVAPMAAASPLYWAIRRLRSRHIPDGIHAAFTAVPWSGMVRLGAYIERFWAGWWPLRPDPMLIADVARSVVPHVIEEVGRMREALIGSAVDGNQRDGVLEVQPRGAFAHVTLRLPQRHAARLWALLQDAYGDEPRLTVADVQVRLSAATPALTALGLTWIDVFGSVAAGTASPASDIDLIYDIAGPVDFECWTAIGETLEAVLGKVVDAHRIGDQTPPDGTMRVWTAPDVPAGPSGPKPGRPRPNRRKESS